ncbi:Ump1p PWA37_000034 [Arxiozyma heterogenica]|uniref:Proteasome maturation factor UMP1 n=1 Tax=Arxiozyma heterogenica TaxID=278026 RepID=A0AAN7WKC1_9SACH|nr:hypothetical protein RI543_004361 [Kazachstania heterogenica]
MPLNIVPPSNFKSQINSVENATHKSNSINTLPDTLREQNGGCLPISTQLNEQHPLQQHLENYQDNEHARTMEQYREIFGIAEPMKRTMELSIVERTDFNPINENHLHSDILRNKDCTIDWEDIYPDTMGKNIHNNIMLGDLTHGAIEKSLGL